MKKFEFDASGNMTVTESKVGKTFEGVDIETFAQHDIQASQLKAHMPMFKDEMTPAEKFTAYGIIEALEAQ